MLTIIRRHAAFVLLFTLLVPLLAACGGGTTETPTTAPTEAIAAATPTTAAAAATPTEAMEEEPTPTEAMEEEPTEEADTGDMTELPDVDPSALEGDIVAAGSSTVFPLAERMAEVFKEDGFPGEVSIASVGSGAGFERFCVNTETDIANASRAINDEEVASCQANGREPEEFQIGIDAIAVVVSQENDFLEDVTLDELAQIFSTATNWSDVRPEWPAEPIQRFIPGTDSGTFDYFVEEVMDPVFVVDEEADEGKGEAAMLQEENLQQSEDDNVLAQGVLGSPYAIGFFGYAYYEENQGELKAIALEGVEPTAETAENGEYPLARPLFMYTTADIMAEKPQVAGFINYVLTNVTDEIESVGYFPMSDQSMDEEKQQFLDATGEGDATTDDTTDAEPTEAAGTTDMIELTEVDPSAVEGDIVVAGSSTVFPLAERMAEVFKEDGFPGEVSIASVGSGAGFERFCVNAETDIANASRAINDEEVAACQANGREPEEFQIGIDALAVVVSQENDFLEDVTLEELAQIFSTATNWSDVRADWPAEPIQRFSPGTDSGTFDYFVEEVMDPVYVVNEDTDEGKGEAALLGAAGLQLSEDDNVLAQGVLGSPYAIGYFGYAYYEESQGDLKAVAIEGVEATAETAENGEYPLARPLFMYTTADIMAEKPQVAAFINYVLTNVTGEIESVGYFPMSDQSMNEEKQQFLDATGE